MPRPVGYKASSEEKERMRAGQRQAWDEKRRPWVEMTQNIRAATGDLSDAEIEQFRVMLLREVRALVAQTKALRNNSRKRGSKVDDPYEGIPTAAERAAARRRVANKLQGEPLGDDAAAYIARKQPTPRKPTRIRAVRGATMTDIRHEPMTGTHSHAHASFGNHVHHDGIHEHAHEHDGDAHHDHYHSPQGEYEELERRIK